ncbi:MAG: ABC transporter ATP-binding protein [Alphaproteobacteria bacterium]|nr:ABC transporter ATP-binding protein [Alphaproteobacteria bacterium]
MTEPYLRLAGVVKSFDGKINAVDGIDLAITKGEFLTLLGPSGSGKTTTLLMVAGFEHPTAGAIELSGRDLTRMPPYRRNVGMVFQNYALFPHMTVEKNIAFPLRMRKFPGPESDVRVRKILELVALTDHAKKFPRQLSGGQQQRVALARGLVFDPDVLLLDEPLGALDKNLREQMQVEIKRIHHEIGITMIYVTHDQTEAMTMSDRVAVFNKGKIEQIAPPLTVYRRPTTRFVGEFIGDSNFFPGAVKDGAIDVTGLGALRPAELDPALNGRAVDVLVRPEWLRVIAPGEAPAGTVAVDLIVADTINYGDSVLIFAKCQGREVRVRTIASQGTALARDSKLRVAIDPANVFAIPR